MGQRGEKGGGDKHARAEKTASSGSARGPAAPATLAAAPHGSVSPPHWQAGARAASRFLNARATRSRSASVARTVLASPQTRDASEPSPCPHPSSTIELPASHAAAAGMAQRAAAARAPALKRYPVASRPWSSSTIPPPSLAVAAEWASMRRVTRRKGGRPAREPAGVSTLSSSMQ